MINDKGPLMFINTVNTQVDEVPQQKVYDSRNAKPKQKTQEQETNVPDKLIFLEERKLNNIIDMYNKNRPVLCNIIVKGFEIVGIPYKKDGRTLFVKISEDSVQEIEIKDIEDIIIIKF
ncbi:MAG: hypothetical protein GX661_05500 [Acholeplasmataceae bacterium]|nr:hypothetical protein [Acholeplasmataceae bacterium]